MSAAPAEQRLCACCKLHPVTSGAHPDPGDLARLRQFAADTNQAVAHVAGVALAMGAEVEDWKRLAAAAAEGEPERAENFRKSAAVAAGTVAQLEVIAQDLKAVTGP